MPPAQNELFDNGYATNQQLEKLERIVHELTKHEPNKEETRSTPSPIGHHDLQTIFDI